MTLTDEGRKMVDDVVGGHLATEERQLECLSKEERASLASLLQILLIANGDTNDRSDVAS